jgi:hypothetical protein
MKTWMSLGPQRKNKTCNTWHSCFYSRWYGNVGILSLLGRVRIKRANFPRVDANGYIVVRDSDLLG